VGFRHEEFGIALEHPTAKRSGMGKMEGLWQGETELSKGIPGGRADPSTQSDGAFAKARSVGPSTFGIAAWNGIQGHVVDADAVALLVMLTGAELVK
jgi:hypothetical protein